MTYKKAEIACNGIGAVIPSIYDYNDIIENLGGIAGGSASFTSGTLYYGNCGRRLVSTGYLSKNFNEKDSISQIFDDLPLREWSSDYDLTRTTTKSVIYWALLTPPASRAGQCEAAGSFIYSESEKRTTWSDKFLARELSMRTSVSVQGELELEVRCIRVVPN